MESSDIDEASVRAATEVWIATFNASDLPGMLALYDARAHLWGTTSPVLIASKEGIAAYFSAVFALQPAPGMALNDVQVRLYGDTAISTGGYTLALGAATNRRCIPARFSFVYRRVDACWLIVDHHSSAMPAPLDLD
ncbi:SgcJ/EcaC family oxidoreductase [Hydrogenophaga sp. PBL-H3]|uniref:SgcJ/EcaC family oxidoreductase n=1 Tax=Hydrogenophaga sp. PBL-H3 TaxID=434010 RepID=UPI00135AAB7E|nr:SgcJ/EcaC family oxidoreductase [Hydrogenophaga sp. PBL-H3]